MGFLYPKSKNAYILYKAYISGLSTEEKIKDVAEKIPCLKDRQDWIVLKNFFENEIYIKTAYLCHTFSNFGNGTAQSKYKDDGITYDEAINVNRYYYDLLSYINNFEKSDIKTIWSTNNYMTGSKKTEKYLDDYLQRNNISTNDLYRKQEIFHLIIGDSIEEDVKGHKIYKSLELPM